jgi:ABC-type sugar transport system ATPase subunit
MGVVLIADTIDELTARSDTIIVMRDGHISGQFDLTDGGPTRLQILELMV